MVGRDGRERGMTDMRSCKYIPVICGLRTAKWHLRERKTLREKKRYVNTQKGRKRWKAISVKTKEKE